MAPLIVITGPTASGKTGLALDLAERYQGEIICADSRTVYRGMDIGTAKPTTEERARVPHHLLDVVDPGQVYNAHNFQQDAKRVIAQIRARNHVPFLVGGTGLYIDAITLDYEWPTTVRDDELNATLAKMTTDELQTLIQQHGLKLPQNDQNRRHLVGTILRADHQGSRRTTPPTDTHVVAIATDKAALHQRIALRAATMFATGVIEETRRLAATYGWESEAMTSNIYPIVRQVIEGTLSEQEAIDMFIARDRQLAKRQLTWLKRHEYITWLPLADAAEHIEGILEQYGKRYGR